MVFLFSSSLFSRTFRTAVWCPWQKQLRSVSLSPFCALFFFALCVGKRGWHQRVFFSLFLFFNMAHGAWFGWSHARACVSRVRETCFVCLSRFKCWACICESPVRCRLSVFLPRLMFSVSLLRCRFVYDFFFTFALLFLKNSCLPRCVAVPLPLFLRSLRLPW